MEVFKVTELLPYLQIGGTYINSLPVFICSALSPNWEKAKLRTKPGLVQSDKSLRNNIELCKKKARIDEINVFFYKQGLESEFIGEPHNSPQPSPSQNNEWKGYSSLTDRPLHSGGFNKERFMLTVTCRKLPRQKPTSSGKLHLNLAAEPKYRSII